MTSRRSVTHSSGWCPQPSDRRVSDPEEESVSEPIPEADSDATSEAWETTEPMDGEAPTG